MNRVLFGLSFLGCFVIASQNTLMATDPMGSVPIKQREFHDLTPKGFNLGTFKIYPTLDIGAMYTSNATKSNTNTQSDKIYRQAIDLTALSISDRSERNIGLKATRLDYQSVDALDRISFSGFAGIKYNFSPSLEARLDTNYDRQYQTRYEIATQASFFDPVQIDELGVRGLLRFKPGFIRWDLKGEYQDISHEDTIIRSTGAPLVQTDRDRSVYSVGLDAAFQKFSSNRHLGFTPFLGIKAKRVDFDKRDYDTATSDFTGLDQSNTQYDVTAGIELNPTGKLRGSARVGYGTYQPDDGSNKVRNDVIMDIDLTYLYTPLTNFTLGVDRFFSNSSDTVGGILQTRLSAKVIHELTRRWIIDGDIAYTNREFNTNGEDTTFETGVGVTHRLNKRFAINGDVKYISRESNQQNGDYDETRAMVRLKTKF